jgi:signal transduction histidine kinase
VTFADWSLRRKLMGGMLLTSGIVLLLTFGTFLTYELVTFRRAMAQSLSTLARVIAANSTAALAFQNHEDATTVLSALAAEPHIMAAALYDQDGRLFAAYPSDAAVSAFPSAPESDGYRFGGRRLRLTAPVTFNSRRQGTIWLQSDLGALYRRLVLYGALMATVLALSSIVAVSLSTHFQKSISRPVMALVDTAAVVADRRDYSARAEQFANDELGRLTQAFNGMLAQIQTQDAALRAREDELRLEVAERSRAEAEVRALNASLEQRVQERTEALQAANKELEAFSYSVSHDLRAPLRAITGFSRILLDDHLAALPEEAAQHLRRVANGATKMGQLVDDLLAFSRLGRAPLVRSLVDPGQIVRQVLDELVDPAHAPAVTIGTLPACHADPSLLKQVYANLIANALKFSGRQPHPEITIGCQTLEETHEAAYFVRDNGAGFDMRYVNKLFGVFQRLHRAEDFEGTGVGLAIVQRVVVRHGGRVWAEGAPDQGACFYFTIGEQS